MEKLVLTGIGEVAQLLSTQDKLKNTFRWDIFPEAKLCRWQSSYEHTIEITWITMRVMFHLKKFYPNLDLFVLLLGAFLHDYGEIIFDSSSPGDVNFHDKKENNDHQLGELQVFSKLVNASGRESNEFFADLLPFYLLQYGADQNQINDLIVKFDYQDGHDLVFRHKEFESKIFDAIENLGYLVFAYQEYLTGKEHSLSFFLEILKDHSPILFKYSQKIKGFELFYSLQDHENILNFIDIHQDVEHAWDLADRLLLEKSKKITFMANEP